MNREECEKLILQKLKEIKAIVKEYDKSNEGHLSVCIIDDYIFAECDDGEVIHFDD